MVNGFQLIKGRNLGGPVMSRQIMVKHFHGYKESEQPTHHRFKSHLKIDLIYLKYSILDNYTMNQDIYKAFRVQVLTYIVILQK